MPKAQKHHAFVLFFGKNQKIWFFPAFLLDSAIRKSKVRKIEYQTFRIFSTSIQNEWKLYVDKVPLE